MRILAHDPRYSFIGRDDQPTDQIVVREIWCENVYRITRDMIVEPHLVIDIGANIGTFSVYCQYLNPDCDVLAYEPEPHNYELLLKNTLKYLKIQTFELAISDKKEDLLISDAGGGSKVGETGEEVHAITLNEIIGDQQVGFLKIDIEGYEGKALLPCTKLDQVRFLAVEYDEHSLNSMGEIVEKLSETHKLTTLGSHLRGAMIYGERY